MQGLKTVFFIISALIFCITERERPKHHNECVADLKTIHMAIHQWSFHMVLFILL